MRMIALFYLLIRMIRQSWFRAYSQWEKCGSWKRWRQCFFDRASFSCHYHGTKRDFSRLYDGWRHRYAVSLNGNPVEFNQWEQWWANRSNQEEVI
jgi:hypothetical protein